MAVKVRMLIPVQGTFHGNSEGAKPGDVIDVSDACAAQYVKVGYAEVLPEERAVVEASPEVELAVPPKKAVGRPRKEPAWHDDDAPGFKTV